MTATATTSNETPVFFDAGDETLLGILTRPTCEPNGRVIVFLAGGGHMFLHRRVAVRLSRRVATMGFHGFRFDYHGVGDSSGEVTGYRLDRPFVDDLLGAVRWLRTQGFEHFIVVGSCFGARTALAAAPQIKGLERLVLLNLHVRNIKRGEGPVTVPESWTRVDVIRRAARGDVLRGLLDPEKRRTYRTSLLDYGRVEMRRLGARIVPSRSDGVASRLLLDSLAQVIEMEVPLLLLFSENSTSYRDFMEARRASLGRLLDRAGDRVRMKTIEGHRLHEVDGQIQLLDIFVSELEGLSSRRAFG